MRSPGKTVYRKVPRVRIPPSPQKIVGYNLNMEIIKTQSFELAILSRGDKNSEKLALILPGRLDTKDYVSCVSHADYLASKGYFAITFDPPGTWESSGTTELFTTTNYIKAVNELIAHFGDKPTLLVGHRSKHCVGTDTQDL